MPLCQVKMGFNDNTNKSCWLEIGLEIIIFWSIIIALFWEGSRNFEIIVEQIFGILETTFNRAKGNKKKVKSCLLWDLLNLFLRPLLILKQKLLFIEPWFQWFQWR